MFQIKCVHVVTTALLLMVMAGGSFGVSVPFTNATGNRLWSDPGNWDMSEVIAAGRTNTVPDTRANWVTMGGSANGPIIAAGMAAQATSIRVGRVAADGVTMKMTGGTLTMNDWLFVGDDNPSSLGYFYMSGGMIQTSNTFIVGYSGQGHAYLSGGSIQCADFAINPNGTSGGALSTLDMSGSAMIITDTDATFKVQDYVALGIMTSYNGDPNTRIVVIYDGIDYPGQSAIFAATIKAYNPNPANNAQDVSLSSTLSWNAPNDPALPTPVTYDVYFGPAGSMVFKGNQSGLIYNPGALVQNTTYQWRIDVVKPDTTKTTGDTWSFKTIYPKVSIVAPAPSGVQGIARTATLQWTSNSAATGYKVYFGTDQTLVTNRDASTYKGQQTGLSYAPALAYATTYYWAIDVVVGATSYPGDLWSFKTYVPVCSLTAAMGDANGDCVVNFKDFAIMANKWLTCGFDRADACP
jgi:hypothetical protein